MGKILKDILEELKKIHYHLDRLDIGYMMVNRIEIKKEEELKDEQKREVIK